MTLSPYFKGCFQRSFGTYPLKGDDLAKALSEAVHAGYRAIDTAQMYGNERDVGAALRQSTVARDELLVTTKVHPDNLGEAHFLPSVEASLKSLGLDCIDVLLIHWPPLDGDVAGPVRRLDEAVKRGLAKAIGVSNFNAPMMHAARQAIDTPLVANQVEFHPLLDQSRLMQAAADTGIPLTSYCSVARGEALKPVVITELAEAYGRTPAQIVLRWILQKGVPITTMSTKPDNLRANFNVMDFVLSGPDMARIDALTTRDFRIVSKEKSPWSPDWTQ